MSSKLTFWQSVENSALLAYFPGALVALYLRICLRTTRWTVTGADEFRTAAEQSAVILVMWHSRILLAPAHVQSAGVKLTTLRDRSPAGQLSGQIQRRFGLYPMAMIEDESNRSASRAILKGLRSGQGLGLTADGPNGPAQVLKSAPLEWARITGAPVFTYSYSTARHRRLSSWDRLLFPLPFTRGALRFDRWQAEIPRRADTAAMAEFNQSLTDALNASQVQTDAEVGIGRTPEDSQPKGV